VLQEIAAPSADRRVREEEDRFGARHVYCTKMDGGYYYWDYQKIRREYSRLEYGLAPNDLKSRARIGGLAATLHPGCMPGGSSQTDIDELVVFLLMLRAPWSRFVSKQARARGAAQVADPTVWKTAASCVTLRPN
jgi:hypothetical protein